MIIVVQYKAQQHNAALVGCASVCAADLRSANRQTFKDHSLSLRLKSAFCLQIQITQDLLMILK